MIRQIMIFEKCIKNKQANYQTRKRIQERNQMKKKEILIKKGNSRGEGRGEQEYMKNARYER